MQVGLAKIAHSRQIAGCRSMAANNKCDGNCAVYRTDADASVNLVYHSLQAAWTNMPEITERNRIYLYAAANLKPK